VARLIQTRQDDLSRDAAEYLLSLQFDERDIARMNELSEMARCGGLGRVRLISARKPTKAEIYDYETEA
jgi:hypothetical protein